MKRFITIIQYNFKLWKINREFELLDFHVTTRNLSHIEWSEELDTIQKRYNTTLTHYQRFLNKLT